MEESLAVENFLKKLKYDIWYRNRFSRH